ncbi:MAG: hypothetical protein HZA50_00470 [Planctomycetes bacterium]|nr:hypothetical protein [Planctomycetota bacterium]
MAEQTVTVKPVIVALVICDNIYIEPTSRKVALVGLFSQLNTIKCPFVHPQIAIYVALTSLRQGSTIKLEIVHGETEKPIIVATGEFKNVVTPLTVVDMHFNLNNVQFETAGTYFVRFWANTHLLVTRPFEVIEHKPTTGEEKI